MVNPSMCVTLAKRDFFKKDLKAHQHVQMGKGRFRCTNCLNMFNTKAAIDVHCLVHQNEEYKYPKCLTFPTNMPTNIRQHERGKHRKGWKAPCGQRFDWPPKMFIDIKGNAVSVCNSKRRPQNYISEST